MKAKNNRTEKTNKSTDAPMFLLTTDKYNPIVDELMKFAEFEKIESNSASGEEILTILIPIAAIVVESFLAAGFEEIWKGIIRQLKISHGKRNSVKLSVISDGKSDNITASEAEGIIITDEALIIGKAKNIVIPR